MNSDEGRRDKKPDILVVEDSPTQAELLRYLLEQNGYATKVAGSGKEALEVLQSHHVDLVLSDVIMPEMDGYELTRTMKGDETLRSIPVILLTALSDPEDIIKGLDAMVDSYLTKPYNESFLLSKVAAALASPPVHRDDEGKQELHVQFRGRSRTVSMAPEQSLNLLLSTYENAVQINSALMQTQLELKALNHDLETKVDERTAHLQEEIAQRKRAEDGLREARDGLEQRVNERTAELVDANKRLQTEITERQRAEAEVRTLNEGLEQRVTQRTAELEASNQELKEFAYVVSHDLKAPLRGVSQLASWLASDHADSLDDDGKEMIEMLQGRLDRMHNLIEGILQYSKIGRTKEEPADVDLDRLARELAEILAPPDHVKVIVENGLPRIRFEPTRAEQVLQNLMGNAIKFMDEPEGEVRVSCADNGDAWTICVSDNGPGIDEKYHDKVFQIFQTLSPRDEFESTGIGLTLVKKIIDLNGGTIWIESQEGNGTAFHFTLPKTLATQ